MKVFKVHCRLDKSTRLDPIQIQIHPATTALILEVFIVVVAKGVIRSLIYHTTRRHMSDDSYIQQERQCTSTDNTDGAFA